MARENYSDIEVRYEGGVATISINRPEKLNAIRMTTYRELIAALRAMPGVFAACLTGCFTRRAECMYNNLAKNIFYHVREAQPQKESFE